MSGNSIDRTLLYVIAALGFIVTTETSIGIWVFKGYITELTSSVASTEQLYHTLHEAQIMQGDKLQDHEKAVESYGTRLSAVEKCCK